MRHRLIDVCLRAYPAAVRQRDRAHLRELALDLAEEHGLAREAWGLLRGGLAERRRQSGTRRTMRTRRAVVAVGAASLLALTALTWTATAQSGRVEEDLLACVGPCPDVEADVASKVRDGWSCSEHREPAQVTWRCVVD